MAARKKTVVLISGRGSNMGALISAAMDPAYPADISLVLSNRPDAKGLERAAEFGIATLTVDHRAFAGDREAFEQALHSALEEHKIELVVLAGFMRVLTPYLVGRWQGRMINIHPSLLPSFKGLNTHERAIDAGVKLHGASVHFVSAELDDGPIIIQGAVPVLDTDTPDLLAARVLEVEHDIYPKALSLVASGAVKISGHKVVGGNGAATTGPLIWP